MKLFFFGSIKQEICLSLIVDNLNGEVGFGRFCKSKGSLSNVARARMGGVAANAL